MLDFDTPLGPLLAIGTMILGAIAITVDKRKSNRNKDRGKPSH